MSPHLPTLSTDTWLGQAPMPTADHPTPIEYRQIEDFPNYRIGNDGTPQGHRKPWHGKPGYWKNLRPQRHTGGYLMVHFFRDQKRHPKYIHRLVLEAFVGPCPPGMEACHRNGDRTDNRIENLRWDTRKNNHADKVIHGTLLEGSKIGNSKLHETVIPAIRRLADMGIYQWQIAEAFGVEQTLVSMIVNGKIWDHVP
jgi:HNH endonuclease